MPSSWLRNERRTFGFRMHVWFALVLIGLTAALFGAAYWFLFRAVQERDREVVQSQFDVYRTWYQEGGLPALMRQFTERRYSGKELFFVRVVGPEQTGLFVSFPPRFEDFDLAELERMSPNEALGWLTVPSRSRSGWWLVATERLPDGDWLQVGKTMDAQGALFAQFRDVSLWVMLVALALGFIRSPQWFQSSFSRSSISR